MGKESLNHCLVYLTYPQIYSGVTVTVLCDVIVNFGKNTNYKICDIPYKAAATQYGFAVSQDTGAVLIVYIKNNTNALYVQSKGVAPSTGDWLWMNIKFICE